MPDILIPCGEKKRRCVASSHLRVFPLQRIKMRAIFDPWAVLIRSIRVIRGYSYLIRAGIVEAVGFDQSAPDWGRAAGFGG